MGRRIEQTEGRSQAGPLALLGLAGHMVKSHRETYERPHQLRRNISLDQLAIHAHERSLFVTV